MKRVLPLLLLLAGFAAMAHAASSDGITLAAPTFAAPAEGQAAGTTACTSNCGAIQANWNAYTANLPSCSATVTASCFLGFQLTLTPPAGTGTAAAVIPPCTTTVTTNCIGPSATTYTWRPGGLLFYGTWNESLVAVAQGTGPANLVTSTPATAPVAYPLSTLQTPAGVSGTIVQ